jgi:hypothetical protein
MRRVLGSILILTPVLVIVSELVAPAVSEDGHESLAVVAGHLSGFRLWVWLGLAAAALMVPAVMALLGLAPARGRRLALVGAALGVVGAIGYAAHQAMFLLLPTLLQGDRDEMAALYERQGQYGEAGILIFLVFLLPLFVGLLLLGIAAYRAGAAPLWPAVVLGLAFVPGFLPIPFDAGLVSFTCLLVGLAAYGVPMLRSPQGSALVAPTRVTAASQ